MRHEIIKFNLSTGEECSLELDEHNHNVFSLLPNITLINPVIPPTLFQDCITELSKTDRPYIDKIFFENVRCTYKIITITLYGHLRIALRQELRRPLPYQDLLQGNDDYKWIESGFLPKFEDDAENTLDRVVKRMENVYKAFKKSKVDGVPYTLPDTYDIQYNYFFEADPTDIKPVFDLYMRMTDPITTGDVEYIKKVLIEKFKTVGVLLIFI